MQILFSYYLKVILCSAIMMLYYVLALRNKKFHRYNRYYLLSVVILSWLIPLVKINITQPLTEASATINQFIYVIAQNNSSFEEDFSLQAIAFNWNNFILIIYWSICCLFLFILLNALYKIYWLLKSNSCKRLGNVYLIATSAKGTPFSFFKYIFWNNEIELNSSNGQQIFQHELIHVQEKHTIDKLIMQAVIVFGWFNPIFWLVKKELNMIHEFIADNKSIQNGNTSLLANMLLSVAYPQQQFLLSNPFFFSPIKRRIAMLTNTKNPKWSYARKVIILPILVITIMLFAFRKQENNLATSNIQLNKTYTVVIDAGHGGQDFGAKGLDGASEKNIALLMAKAIKEANANSNIKLVFTREEDIFQTPVEKAAIVNEQKPDLFISLHVNTDKNTSLNGIEIYVPYNDDRKNIERCKQFASMLHTTLLQKFKSNGLKTSNKGIWILKATECTAALIECGFISNAEDLAILKDKAKRKQMASLILQGIENYLKTLEEENN
ncbi:MAG: M56/M15 family metallopeptidase [Chitinophagales bacterium]|nr:M56/M15 family metallopeptidase [Chitinophagales bacterium]